MTFLPLRTVNPLVEPGTLRSRVKSVLKFVANLRAQSAGRRRAVVLVMTVVLLRARPARVVRVLGRENRVRVRIRWRCIR